MEYTREIIEQILTEKRALFANYQGKIQSGLWKEESVIALVSRLKDQIDFWEKQLKEII